MSWNEFIPAEDGSTRVGARSAHVDADLDDELDAGEEQEDAEWVGASRLQSNHNWTEATLQTSSSQGARVEDHLRQNLQ